MSDILDMNPRIFHEFLGKTIGSISTKIHIGGLLVENYVCRRRLRLQVGTILYLLEREDIAFRSRDYSCRPRPNECLLRSSYLERCGHQQRVTAIFS